MTAKLPTRSWLDTFSRSQVTSFAATCSDWGLLFFLTEICHVWYVIATACGALTGAIVNFLLNRHWTFQATHRHWHGQALRYAITSAASLCLNTAGVWGLTEATHIHYSISVLSVSLVVGFFFNYPMQRFFVYR
ncbi:MAG: GtrA family protein [Bdellovibrionota bacterium]